MIAMILLLYYWDILIGIYQTMFLLFGFLPSVVAFFAVLCLWTRRSKYEVSQRFIQEDVAKKQHKMILEETDTPSPESG